MSDYNLSIDTPENLALEAEIAGFGSRCVASLVDHIILFIMLIVLTIAYAQISADLGDENVILAVYVLLQFALFTFYHLFFEFLLNGQTPGKRLFGIRVVQANGMPATTIGLLIRNIVRVFDFFPIFYTLGIAVLFGTRRTQRLGDIAARTLVVYEKGEISLQSLTDTPSLNYRVTKDDDPFPIGISTRDLSDADKQALFNFLERRTSITMRESIAMTMANKYGQQMGMSEVELPTRHYDAEKLLEYIARAYSRQT